MDEINLNQIIIDHPDCLTSGSKLRAILLDLYPSASKAIVNTLATMVGAGITDEIIRAEGITDLDKARWHKKLEDDYGLSEKIICSCLDLFLGSQNSIKICIKANEKPVNTPSLSGQTQKPSHSSLYDFEIVNGVLKKYKGKGSIVVIPNNVTSIGFLAFVNCSSLTSITIPNSVTSIGKYAFSDCNNLLNITIPRSVTSIGEYSFFGCCSLTNFDVKNNKYYQAIDGNLYSKDGKTLIQYAIGKKANSFTIPNNITSIGSSAFRNCVSLTSITIPNSVMTIGDWAFRNCSSLTSVKMSDRLTSIGNMAFEDCSSLTNITIPDSVTSIGHRVFDNCSELKQIDFTGSEDQWKSIKKAARWNQGIPINCKTYFSLPLKYVHHKQLGYGKVEVISDRVIYVCFDTFIGRPYIYRKSDIGTVLRQVSENEYFSDRKPAKQTPPPPPVYRSYLDDDKQPEDDFAYWNRLCNSGGSYVNYLGDEYPDYEHNYTDDDNTDDECDYSDDYDFSDADYDNNDIDDDGCPDADYDYADNYVFPDDEYDNDDIDDNEDIDDDDGECDFSDVIDTDDLPF